MQPISKITILLGLLSLVALSLFWMQTRESACQFSIVEIQKETTDLSQPTPDVNVTEITEPSKNSSLPASSLPAKRKTYLINYASNCCRTSQSRGCEAGLRHGFNVCIPYTEKDLDADFAERYKDILSQPRGAGYWLWKPYIILKTMERTEPNSTIFYMDSGSYFIDSAAQIIQEIDDEEIWQGELFQTEIKWCKRDALILLNADNEEYTATNQRVGSFFGVKNTLRAKLYITQWLAFASDPRALTDMPSTLGPEHPAFVDHRHDQCVGSLLGKRWKLPPHRDPSQWGGPGNVIMHDRNKS